MTKNEVTARIVVNDLDQEKAMSEHAQLKPSARLVIYPKKRIQMPRGTMGLIGEDALGK